MYTVSLSIISEKLFFFISNCWTKVNKLKIIGKLCCSSPNSEWYQLPFLCSALIIQVMWTLAFRTDNTWNTQTYLWLCLTLFFLFWTVLYCATGIQYNEFIHDKQMPLSLSCSCPDIHSFWKQSKVKTPLCFVFVCLFTFLYTQFQFLIMKTSIINTGSHLGNFHFTWGKLWDASIIVFFSQALW